MIWTFLSQSFTATCRSNFPKTSLDKKNRFYAFFIYKRGFPRVDIHVVFHLFFHPSFIKSTWKSTSNFTQTKQVKMIQFWAWEQDFVNYICDCHFSPAHDYLQQRKTARYEFFRASCFVFWCLLLHCAAGCCARSLRLFHWATRDERLSRSSAAFF